MSGFIPIYWLIAKRLLRRRRLITLSLVAAIPGLLLLIIERAEFVSVEEAYQEVSVFLFLLLVLPLVTLILSSAALGEERRRGTMPYLVLKPVPRWVIVLAATAAAISASLLIGMVGWAVGWVVAGRLGESFTIAVPFLIAVVISALGYPALFVPLGYLTRWAVLIGLAYVFVWEAILTSFVEAIGTASISRIALSAYAALTDLGTETIELLGSVLPGAGGAIAKTVVVLLASVAFTTTLLRRRDI